MSDDSAAREDRIRQALERSRSRRTSVVRRPDPGAPAPLTRFQEGLWYNAILAAEEGRASELRPAAFRLVGPLDLDAITAAVRRLQERQLVLRTVFPAEDAVPMQVLTGRVAEIQLHDLSAVDAGEGLEKAREFARSLALGPFDIEHEPPFQPHIVRLGPDDHLLVFSMHHLVFDGWSADVLRWELEHGYAIASGIPCEQEVPLKFGVADYAAWEREREDRDEVEGQMQYWRSRLDGIEGELELPVERPAPTLKTPIPVTFDLESELMIRFAELGRSLDATPFMMLLAASQVLAARLSRQQDFVVAVATAGRSEPDVDRLIGCFINMMLLRAQLREDMTFADVVSAARSEVLGGLANQRAPFSRIVSEHLRSGSHQVPFKLLVQMRSFPSLPALPAAGLSWETFNLDMPAAAAVTIEGRDLGPTIRVYMSYDPEVFSAETIERWSGHLHTLITSAVETPDASVWDLDVLTAAEREQLTTGSNEPNLADNPPLVSDLLNDQTAADPDRVAFEDGTGALSYRQLTQEADGFAKRIRNRGARRGTRIVLLLEPGLEAAIAVLGALRSGAAYVPADPSLSASWLAGIVAETEPVAVITHRRLMADVSHLDVPTVAVEDLMGPIEDGTPVLIEPEDVAYVCYTSGSTGAPKGVVITQGNLAAVLENQTYCRYGPGSRELQIYSIAFDAYVIGLLGPLVNGVTAVLSERDALASAEQFLGSCAAEEITHMDIPTSLFHTIVDEMDQGGLSFPRALEHITIGGEQVRADAVERFYRLRDHEVRLHNTYGPTETTVWVLRKDLTEESDVPLDRVPIGSPVPNASAYILDRCGQPAPLGVAGELNIGGSQVGVGYLGNPRLTEERFVRDPFSDEENARLYRTGDLARWLPNGEIEFLGRVDRQVKIRGFRAEPEAVEAVLRGHPLVADAAVVDAVAADGSTTLRGYIVPEGTEPAESDLRLWCRASLPGFMVPGSFTVLDELPRTLSHKLDRARLPEPGAADSIVAERGPIASTIAGIWCDVLGLDDIPAGGDFFALGGHSLVAMRVIGRVRRVFEVDVPLSALFDNPTIDDFASAVAENASPDWQKNEMDELLSGLAELNPEEAAALLAAIDPDGGG
ncbi:MAG: amino acid adenylation domain-containing protein [Acidimicrobiia bacterium]